MLWLQVAPEIFRRNSETPWRRLSLTGARLATKGVKKESRKARTSGMFWGWDLVGIGWLVYVFFLEICWCSDGGLVRWRALKTLPFFGFSFQICWGNVKYSVDRQLTRYCKYDDQLTLADDEMMRFFRSLTNRTLELVVLGKETSSSCG